AQRGRGGAAGGPHRPPAGPGENPFAPPIHLEAVGHPGVVGGHVEQDAAAGEAAVRPHREGADVLLARVVDVQRRLVGGEGETVGQREVVDDEVPIYFTDPPYAVAPATPGMVRPPR